MEISWKVLWRDEDNKKRFRRFPGRSPTEAIDFAKSLKKTGLTYVNVICANKGWPPTKKQEANRRPGMMWCPYCIKWRNFKLFAIRTRFGYRTEAFMRCPVCTISTQDYNVRRYNGFIEHISERELIKRTGGVQFEGR